jgi:hypothetical protein
LFRLRRICLKSFLIKIGATTDFEIGNPDFALRVFLGLKQRIYQNDFGWEVKG